MGGYGQIKSEKNVFRIHSIFDLYIWTYYNVDTYI